MNLRRSIAAGTLALTTVITAGPLTATVSAQTDTTSPPVAQNTNCRRIVKQVRNATRRLTRAQGRLAFWQKVASEMPARIAAQQATVTDLQAQLAAATGDAATELQAQLDRATEKLTWMQAKLDASARRIPLWTAAIARLTAIQTTLTDQATTGNCPLPTTTTAPADEAGDDNGGGSSSSSSTSSTVPGDDSGNDLGDDKGGERTGVRAGDDDSPASTVEDRTAAERVAEAQRKAAERQAEAQRKAAERQAEAQRRAAERQAEGQRRAAERQAEGPRKAAESGRRNRGGHSPTTSPAPTVDDRGGSSGRDGSDD